LRALDGNASHRGRVLPHPSAATPATPAPPLLQVDEEHAPDDLGMDERRVWLELAPIAQKKGTLTADYMYAFKLLCRNVVLERALRLTDAATPNHRGLMQRIEVALDHFMLRPFGKPAAGAVEQPAVDPVKEKYFGGR